MIATEVIAAATTPFGVSVITVRTKDPRFTLPAVFESSRTGTTYRMLSGGFACDAGPDVYPMAVELQQGQELPQIGDILWVRAAEGAETAA